MIFDVHTFFLLSPSPLGKSNYDSKSLIQSLNGKDWHGKLVSCSDADFSEDSREAEGRKKEQQQRRLDRFLKLEVLLVNQLTNVQTTGQTTGQTNGHKCKAVLLVHNMFTSEQVVENGEGEEEVAGFYDDLEGETSDECQRKFGGVVGVRALRGGDDDGGGSGESSGGDTTGNTTVTGNARSVAVAFKSERQAIAACEGVGGRCFGGLVVWCEVVGCGEEQPVEKKEPKVCVEEKDVKEKAVEGVDDFFSSLADDNDVGNKMKNGEEEEEGEINEIKEKVEAAVEGVDSFFASLL